MPRKRTAPSLTFSEAYHAAQTFLVHMGATPSRLNEPVDGIVEFEGGGYFSRLRYDDGPVTQGAVLGLLKLVEEQEETPILFSATGFSGAAEVFANNLDVALFSIMPNGDMKAHSRSAHSLMPTEPFEPPFADAVKKEEVDRPPGALLPGQSRIADHEWVDCPTCGTTHHPDANFCHRCGAGLARKNRVDPTARRRNTLAAADAPDGVEARGRSVAKAGHAGSHDGAGMMRCRNCGSHDIERLEE